MHGGAVSLHTVITLWGGDGLAGEEPVWATAGSDANGQPLLLRGGEYSHEHGLAPGGGHATPFPFLRGLGVTCGDGVRGSLDVNLDPL